MKQTSNRIFGFGNALIVVLALVILHFCFSYWTASSIEADLFVFLFYSWKNKFFYVNDQSIDIFILFIRIKRIKLLGLKKVEFASGADGVMYLAAVGFYFNDDKSSIFIANLSSKEIKKFKQHLKTLNIDSV